MRWGPRRERPAGGPSLDDLVADFLRDVVADLPRPGLPASAFPGTNRQLQAAARDRGLTVREIDGNHVFYDGRFPVGAVAGILSSLTSGRAVRACRSKDRTKLLLDATGVATPAWHGLERDGLETALGVLDGRTEWVLKPALGVGGKGITCGIRDAAQLRAAWAVALEGCREESTMILEEQVVGLDVRVFVVGQRVVAAATRLPPYVVGDGQRSVEALVAAKQAVRVDLANVSTMPIVLDRGYLTRSGRSVDAVPRDGELVLLSDVANLSRGGENVDVTDLLGAGLRELAVDAARSVPGLGVGGVDLLVRSYDSTVGATVLEVNARPGVGVHHCPVHGRPQDVSGAVIDRMIELSR